MKGKASKFVAIASLLAGALALSLPARAEYVQCETPHFGGVPSDFFGKGSKHGSSLNAPVVVHGASLRVDSLQLTSAGSLTIRLGDLQFPQPLEQLSLLVTDLHGIWQTLDRAGDLTIDLTGPAKLFIAVFARTGGGGPDRYGLYHVNTQFTAAVPLPAAAWLLLSGLGGLGLLRRRVGKIASA